MSKELFYKYANQVEGTPQNLDHAVCRILQNVGLNQLMDGGYDIIRDFLAQRFSTAMMSCDAKTSEALKELFKQIVKREES